MTAQPLHAVNGLQQMRVAGLDVSDNNPSVHVHVEQQMHLLKALACFR